MTRLVIHGTAPPKGRFFWLKCPQRTIQDTQGGML
jgi:hypothetical protein